MSLQTAMGVTADGIAGPQTYKAFVNYKTAYSEGATRKAFKFINKDANPKYAENAKTLSAHFSTEEIEGSRPHVGGDAQNLTLPMGIVADSVKVNGNVVKAGKNTLTSDWVNNNSDKIDLMTAVKTVNGTTFKAEDYTTYEEFAKDVIDAFTTRVKSDLPNGLDDKYLPVFASTAWNLGETSGTYSGMQTTANELLLPESQWNMANVTAIGKHSYDGGKPSLAILKRRMQDLNLVLPATKKLAKVKQRYIKNKDNTINHFEMDVYNKQGAVVNTIVFPTKYKSVSNKGDNREINL
jgi:hypothetical protein